jgi:cytochrome c oxidase subunit 3
MTDLDAPYATEAAADEDAHAHGQHLSPWPIFLGFTAPILAIGIVTHPVAAVVGAILVLIGLVGWVREDTLEFPKGPNPLTQHTFGRKDNGWWGLWLFLATEVVLFGALFATYFSSKADAAAGEWPPHDFHLPALIAGINTALLVSSGVVMHFGELALKKGNRRGFLLGFGGAILLGAIFLIVQINEYVTLVGQGSTLGSGIFASAFFILTGTHGVHVFGGLIFLTVIFVRGAKGQFDHERHTAVTAGALYWHFVDIVWIMLFAIVYLQVI